MYGWSKWGGARHGLVKEELDEWYCQACKEKQTRSLPNYMFDYFGDKRDYIRICSKCKNKVVKENIEYVRDLFQKIRKDYIEDKW